MLRVVLLGSLLLWSWSSLLCASTVSRTAQALSPASLHLLEAAYVGSIKGVRQALADGADIHTQVSSEYLCDIGYRGNLHLEYDNSAVVIAASRGHEEIVAILLDNGANPNDVEHGGDSVLHLGIRQNSVQIVHLALENGADPNAIDSLSDPALTKVAWFGVHTSYIDRFMLWGKQVEMMRLLIEHGADPNLGGNNGRTPLTVSVHGGFTKSIEFLLANGADVNIATNNGETPLLAAAENAVGLKIIKMLLKAGAKVNAANRFGGTPLHVVAEHKEDFPRTVKLLLNNGADVNAKNNAGKTPLDLVRQRLQTWQEMSSDGATASWFSGVGVRLRRYQATVKIIEKWMAKYSAE